MLLSAGDRGKRFMTSAADCYASPAKNPKHGELQATELQIKRKEVKAQKQAMVDILTMTTGNPAEKIEKVRVPSCGNSE